MEPLEIQEQGWTKIDSQEIWEKLNQTINGGHDGVLKNLEWSHGEYVDSELNMVFADVPKIWLLVQLQNELVSSVEFLFIGVEEMRVNPKNELILNAQIEATQ